MLRQEIKDNWKMKKAGTAEYVPAVVPGSVYTDLLREGRMKDPFYGDNEDEALRLMDDDFEYETEFDCGDELLGCDRILLHFDGIDTIADVYLNGSLLGSPENMHRVWEYDVKSLVRRKKNELRVRLHSPTKYIAKAYMERPTRGTEDAMDGFVHIRKAHCMFGWDWGAHLPDAGIFRPVYLLGAGSVRIDSVYITQHHEEGCVTLFPKVELDVRDGAATDGIAYRIAVTDPDGASVTFDGSPESIKIYEPKLWWANGYGEQNLYVISTELYAKKDGGEALLDTKTTRIGLRTLTVRREKDKWGESFAFCLNGVDIFSMGADYIPEDHLLGRVTEKTTRTLLEKAKWANFNSIRVWGGGYYPNDWFYDICDELGLIVWQDFMFACAVYDLTPEFEANIRAEFADNIKRIRNHACLGLWCGNNEMESFIHDHTDMVTKPSEVRDYLIMCERIIPEELAKYDPSTFYWPSSPSSGGSFDSPQDPNRGDVHFWDVWHGSKPFTEYRRHYFRFLSEFGFQSFPTKKTIEEICDPSELNIFSYTMERHQRSGSGNGKMINYMQQTYRYPTDFGTLLYASQLLQADAIRYGVEHFRRSRGRCMGALYWQLNDCWQAASWSSIDYRGRLKALHYAAKRFFAPLMLSCEEMGLMTSGKSLVHEHFEFEKSARLCVANETMKERRAVVRYALRDAYANVISQGEKEVLIPALGVIWLDKIEFPTVDIYGEYFSYELVVDGKTVSEGTVIFSYPKYFRYKDPHLSCRVVGDEIEVTASAYARYVEILNENEDLILSDNYFDMNGGTKRVKIESGDASKLRLRSTYDIK
ncbi:MAG: glycoside hydrolase family 2 protein [Firmicutes bacterium]|nr:glycoside hydrolase family 2 protein [Bacillota bacterium]